MGEFDDVMALGPGDDWDAWDQWAAAADEERSAMLAAPRARLDVAGVIVELRGEFDDELLEPFSHLLVDTSGVVDGAVRLKLGGPVTGTDQTRPDAEQLTGRDDAVMIRPDDNPTEVLAGVLEGLVVADWPARLALSGSCVELDTADGAVGVVLLSDEPADRAALLAELVAMGAGLVATERVVLRPGTRTVTALAVPRPVDSVRLVGHTTVDVVVNLRREPGSPVCAAQLGTLDALEQWARRLVRAENAGALSATIVAGTLSGADFWELVEAIPAQAAQFVVGLRAPASRRLVTVDRVDNEADVDARLIRVHPDPGDGGGASGGVVMDPRARTVDRLDGASGVGEPGELTRWAVEAAAGKPHRQEPRAVAVLDEVMGLLGGEDAEALPVLVGDFLIAHDGQLPAWLFDGDRVDLLVEPEHLERLRELLPSAGFVAPSPTDRLRDPTDGRVEQWRSQDGEVVVGLHRQLAAGPFGELVDHDELVARARPVRIGRRWYPGLHPEDRFVHAAALAAGDLSDRDGLRSVALSAPDDPGLAASAMEAAERWGAIRGVLAAVSATQREFGGLDNWLVERSRRDDPPRRVGRRRGR